MSPESGQPAVDIVVVNWNTSRAAASTARSHSQSTGVTTNVTMIDNASVAEDREHLREIRPEGVRLIFSERNLGYGAAVNRALGDGNAELVCISNADVQVEPGALAAMAEVALLESSAGMVGPVFGSSGDNYHDQLPSPAILLTRTFAGSFGRKKLQMPDSDHMAPVGQPAGACFMVRRAVWEEFGGFDEGFFLWYEDVDLAKRMDDAGYMNLIVGSARATHSGAAAFQQIDHGGWQEIRLPSLERYIRKHHEVIVPLAVPLIRASGWIRRRVG